ncbi:MAG: Bro-N domain-containing protein [Bacteroidales bacterium]|jgi:prophage antirepressor-like protein|nr:Bro-N domain-containing protein [Bacteroidales bacterium]
MKKKLTYLPDSSGQLRKTLTINEFGLYLLILSSSKPEAKTFKRWVTYEVLSSIRKLENSLQNRRKSMKFHCKQ